MSLYYAVLNNATTLTKVLVAAGAFGRAVLRLEHYSYLCTVSTQHDPGKEAQKVWATGTTHAAGTR
jgi:hypothetical protein